MKLIVLKRQMCRQRVIAQVYYCLRVTGPVNTPTKFCQFQAWLQLKSMSALSLFTPRFTFLLHSTAANCNRGRQNTDWLVKQLNLIHLKPEFDYTEHTRLPSSPFESPEQESLLIQSLHLRTIVTLCIAVTCRCLKYLTAQTID